MMTVSLVHYLILAAILFSIGVMGIFINRRNLIMLLMSIEVMLLAINLNFIAFSHYLGDIAGQVFVIFILTVATAMMARGIISSPFPTISGILPDRFSCFSS